MAHVDCLTFTDDTQFNLSHSLGNLRTTCAIPMKHFPNEKKLVANILNLKCDPHVTSDHVEMVYFLGWSEFTGQDIQAKIRTMAYLGFWGWYQLETFTSKSPWQNNPCYLIGGLETFPKNQGLGKIPKV